MEYVISIAKRYNHARTHYRDPRNRGIKGAKRVLGIYVINEDGKLRFRKISRLMIPYYRTKLWKRRVCYCLECGSKCLCLMKKETDEPECPYCLERDVQNPFPLGSLVQLLSYFFLTYTAKRSKE